MSFKFLLALIFGVVVIYGTNIFYSSRHDSEDVTKEFSTYWYDGKAEITSYTLSQNRYGELRDGHAVLIFVTEDFSKIKQVKLDDAENAGGDRQAVLKLNFSKNFLTGIYPYSILNSVFTPVDLSGSVKTSCSIQEWCGHTFTQLNKTKTGFKSNEFSYFESEGDKSQNFHPAILEDELWNLIRINPEKIELGNQKIIRGNMAVRLLHQPREIVEVELSRSIVELNNEELWSLNIAYPKRTLKIYYKKQFPHMIQGWDETYAENEKKPLTTKARLKKSLRLPYWQLNKNQHLVYRDSLGI